jgi:polysaccharide chain length determinant protein (PEP-CTERM system associated)
VRLYIEENTSSKLGESSDAAKFLTEQIDTFKSKLDKTEAAENVYKRGKGDIIAIDEGKLFEEINIARQKLYDLELQRKQLEGTRQLSKKGRDPLQIKLISLQKNLDELRSKYTENYPEVISVKGEIETVKGLIAAGKGVGDLQIDPQELAKIDLQIAAIKESEDGMKRYITSNQAIMRTIPSAKAELEKLELSKNNLKNIYDQLFARQGQSEVSKQMEVQDKSTTFRIVDPAILPTKPVSSNRLKIMLMGILGGIAGSFGILLFLDQNDKSLKGVDYAKGFGMPILAVIPHIQDLRETELQRKQNVWLYALAGAYFLLILSFPAMEVLGLSFGDKLVDSIHYIDFIQNLKDHLQ